MKQSVLAAVLGIGLAGSIGGNAYQYTRQMKNDEVANDRAKAIKARDSLQNVLFGLRDSLELVIPALNMENQMMAGKVSELESSNTELRGRELALLSRIKQMQKQLTGMSPAELDKFKKELEQKNEQIKELQSYIAKVKEERDNNARIAESERQTRSAMEQENNNMRGLVERGKTIQFGPVLTYGVRTVKGAQEETFKAKTVEKLKITFDLIENALVEQPTEQEIKIRVIGPEGEILSKNTSQLIDKSEAYTLRETLVFDGEMHKVKLYYSQPSFKKGKYAVELWSDNVIKQKNTFTLE
jgi:vacuolar-type H+-ATPase subunit I/STV1